MVRRAKVTKTKIDRLVLPRPGAAKVQGDAALVVRFVRFMDGMFGASNWEEREYDSEDTKALRHGLFMAFRAGAGLDD